MTPARGHRACRLGRRHPTGRPRRRRHRPPGARVRRRASPSHRPPRSPTRPAPASFLRPRRSRPDRRAPAPRGLWEGRRSLLFRHLRFAHRESPWGAPTRPHAPIPPTDLTVSHIREFSARTWKTRRRRRGTWSEGPRPIVWKAFSPQQGISATVVLTECFRCQWRLAGDSMGSGLDRPWQDTGSREIWRNQFNLAQSNQ